MPVDRVTWRFRKELMWKRIWEDLEIGYLDRDLLPLLVLVNMDSELYTTSSCSGRITAMDSDYPWIRDETGIVFKSHVPITPRDLNFTYELKPHKKIWVIVTGPIIHIYCLTAKKAVQVIEVARRTGFKHSGIMHIGKTRGIFLELVTGIYISQLIRTADSILVEPIKLEALVELLNSALLEGKKRLQKLYVELSKLLPEKADSTIEGDLRCKRQLVGKSPVDVFIEMCKEKRTKCELY